MSIFKTLAEGGQIWAHRVRMVRQVIRIVFLLSLASGTAFFVFRMSREPSFQYQAIYYYLKAGFLSSSNTKISVDSEFWRQAEGRRSPEKTIEIKAEKLKRTSEKALQILWKKAKSHLEMAVSLSFIVSGVSILFFLIKGFRSRRKEHIEGQRITTPWKSALKLRLTWQASPIKIGRLPLVKGTETHHILISGGTGSGKTNAFHHLLPQIRKQGQRAVVVDVTGEYIEKYYREGKDIILNPFDRRTVAWHPWCECSEEYDYKSIAQSFIPLSYNDDENFWRKAAQEVFCTLLQKTSQEQRLSHLTKLLLYDSLPKLCDYLRDTKAAASLDMATERTAGSIRAVSATFLEALEHLQDTRDSFSIKNWVREEKDDSWLFLFSTPGQRASMIPLLSAWFSIAIQSLLVLKPNIQRRLWFIADELPKLHKLKDLESCLTESRKYGGCMLMAIQSPAQLEMIYGREATSVMIGNCGTRVAFSERDPRIAAQISKTFGEKETRELQEGISYGAHEMRDGVSLSIQTRTSPVISPTAIQSLKTHHAFVMLPNNLPVAKIKLKYKAIPKICESFLES